MLIQYGRHVANARGTHRTHEKYKFSTFSIMMHLPTKKMISSDKSVKTTIATVQDIKYARSLAGNDKKIRDKAIKSLKNWFEQRCKSSLPLTEGDLLLIWKGLFYSMWMADKPLIQEECAERISSLIHSLDADTGILFFKTGLITLGNEWFGIDQWRSDKFLMFVRRFLRQAIVHLKNHAYNIKLVRSFASCLNETVLQSENAAPLSLVMHFSDIYLPELAKITDGELNPNMLNAFLMPFIIYLAKANDSRLIDNVAENVFRYLIRQSTEGLEYEDKFRAWQQMGFAGGNINALQKASSDDDESDIDMDAVSDSEEEATNGEKPLDPRAGHVDVLLPQLAFSAKHMNTLLTDHKFEAKNTKARGTISKLIDEFNKLANGQYPLGIKSVELDSREDRVVKTKQSANRLLNFNNKLLGKKKEAKVNLKENKPESKKKKLLEKLANEQNTLDSKSVNNDSRDDHLAGTKKSTKTPIDLRNKLLEKRKEAKANLKAKKVKAEKKKLLESKLTKKKKEKPARVVNPKVPKDSLSDQIKFERNSGTWFVCEPETDSGEESDFSPKKSPKKQVTQSPPKTPSITVTSPQKKVIKRNSPRLSMETSTPKKLSPTNTKTFHEVTEWDKDLQNGEVEIFVPSKKYLEKRKSEGASAKLLETSFSMIKGKGKRKFSDTDMVINPLAFTTPNNKKVKIDLRLNKSQEFHEHFQQLKNSPTIPFDATKKPSRSVIKPSAVASPINPFYKRKINTTF